MDSPRYLVVSTNNRGFVATMRVNSQDESNCITDNKCIVDVRPSAGADNVLLIGLNMNPGRYLYAVVESKHDFAFLDGISYIGLSILKIFAILSIGTDYGSAS